MTGVVLFKSKAEGRRDAGEMPLGASQLTDNAGIGQNKPAPLAAAKRIFKVESNFSFYQID